MEACHSKKNFYSSRSTSVVEILLALGDQFCIRFSLIFSVTISAESPIGISGAQFGGQLEFGENCLYDADFDNDVRVQILFFFAFLSLSIMLFLAFNIS